MYDLSTEVQRAAAVVRMAVIVHSRLPAAVRPLRLGLSRVGANRTGFSDAFAVRNPMCKVMQRDECALTRTHIHTQTHTHTYTYTHLYTKGKNQNMQGIKLLHTFPLISLVHTFFFGPTFFRF